MGSCQLERILLWAGRQLTKFVDIDKRDPGLFSHVVVQAS